DADEPSSARKGAPPGEAVFDPDPDRPWNRLHRLFFLLEMGEGRTYAHDGLEAPFGREGTFLVEGPRTTWAACRPPRSRRACRSVSSRRGRTSGSSIGWEAARKGGGGG